MLDFSFSYYFEKAKILSHSVYLVMFSPPNSSLHSQANDIFTVFILQHPLYDYSDLNRQKHTHIHLFIINVKQKFPPHNIILHPQNKIHILRNSYIRNFRRELLLTTGKKTFMDKKLYTFLGHISYKRMPIPHT